MTVFRRVTLGGSALRPAFRTGWSGPCSGIPVPEPAASVNAVVQEKLLQAVHVLPVLEVIDHVGGVSRSTLRVTISCSLLRNGVFIRSRITSCTMVSRSIACAWTWPLPL